MKICIFGTGNVGPVAATCLAESGSSAIAGFAARCRRNYGC